MKNSKKLLSLVLAALTISSFLASCSNSDVNSEDTSAQTNDENPTADITETEEETRKFLDDLPESMDFAGESMRFIVEEGGNGNLTELSIMAEEDTGEVVDSAVYQRNLTVQDRLNIVIELSDVLGSGGIMSNLKNSIQAGSDDWDIIGAYQYYGIKMGPEGYLYNLANFDNLDFSREYWGSEYIENMTYDGISFWATGDLALRYTGGMYVTYINQSIWNDYYPDVDVYDIVNEGRWTLDALYEYSDAVYLDKNGNSKVDADDLFGLVLDIEDPMEGMAAGSMIRWTAYDDDGLPYVALGTDRTYTFYEKMLKLVANNNGFWHHEDDNTTVMTMFAESKAMIGVNKLYQSGVFLRDMEEEFRIIPVPKLNEEQEHYNTMIHDSCTLYGIPITNTKLDATTCALECMASESFKVVTPAYYEVALKVKYARDDETGMMIDLIRENVSSDFICLYSNSIADVAHFFRGTLQSKKDNITSQIEKSQKIWSKNMEKLMGKFEENSGR